MVSLSINWKLKKTSRNINDGKTQALAYANALEREYGQRRLFSYLMDKETLYVG